jgi:[acyl-carrier-protein] S-malonyltransferase
MLAMVAPGQGAQRPGFLTPWLELPGAADLLGVWSDIAEVDLIRMGTSADIDELTDTAVAQPLLVAAALLGAGQLAAPDVAAGHSVGELAAGVIAGVLSAPDAIRLASIRGRAMAQAARLAPTGMTAVLGGDQDTVRAAITAHGLTAANINADDQVVAAGTLSQLTAFAASPPPGVRVRVLPVAGAFHTAHMAPAAEKVAAAVAGLALRNPVVTLLSNRDGVVVSANDDWAKRIVYQVAAPVRWDLCIKAMAHLGVTALVELPPAGPLSGLAKRALPGVRLVTLKTPGQLADARALTVDMRECG